jgi:acyl-CoA hydrolase
LFTEAQLHRIIYSANLLNVAGELYDVELTSIGLHGEAMFNNPELKSSFRLNSLFVSNNVRDMVNDGRGDYIPVFLSEIPNLFKRNILPLDVALVQVCPPDKHGYCSLGVSVDVVATAVKCAKHVIAQVNPRMPRTHGDSMIHMRDFDAMVYFEQELPEVVSDKSISEISQRIGELCASLVEDGATIQTGIGAIPEAVLASLGNHKDLGMHTEMFSDGIIPLVEKGVINNKFKRKHKGKIVSSFILGSRRLYDFVDDNPSIAMLGIDYTNDTAVIRQTRKLQRSTAQ